MPSAMVFVDNLRIKSTPLMSRQQPLASAEEATFNLPRGRTLQVSENVPVPAVPAPPFATASKTLRGLSPIDEISREYFSSSGSSAGTTGLAHSRLSVGRSLHCAEVGRVYPPHFDPFDNNHRVAQLTELAIPLQERRGFHRFSGRSPMLRSNFSVQLGGSKYIIKPRYNSVILYRDQTFDRTRRVRQNLRSQWRRTTGQLMMCWLKTFRL